MSASTESVLGPTSRAGPDAAGAGRRTPQQRALPRSDLRAPHGGPANAAGANAVDQTFVLADLAGYTALTEIHGDEQAADAAEEFSHAVRDLLPSFDAVEVKAIGDAMLVRAPGPAAGVRLAARIVVDFGMRHRGLGIRAGVHTGTAARRGADWFGSAVNVAARVADLARGGQVLLTEPTRRGLPPSLAVRAVGPTRLRNVSSPVALYELVLSSELLGETLRIDPVCRMVVDPSLAAATRRHQGAIYSFCSSECLAVFEAQPRPYARG